MSLREFIEKYPQFKKVVKYLERFLTVKPEEIQVCGVNEAEIHVPEKIKAFTVKPDKIYFKQIPPDIYLFTHELIHLCDLDLDLGDEEVYAYNLARAVVYVAEKGIEANVFKLFELSRRDIERVLGKYGFKSIEDYYTFRGIVPPTHKLIVSEDNGKRFTVAPREGVSEKEIIREFVSDIIDLVGMEPFSTELFMELIRLCE